ncbi:MAG: acyl-CoA thioesterase [Lachnospiraceae bacterium]|nr:acyl-CoA thioesterase [Lachnospiraceae bacterium]
MKKYETLHLVKEEDLNHHGTLFAARAAAWLVEAGFATAACEHGNTDEIVMRNLQNMSFFKPVKKGTVVRFEGQVVYTGNTSLMVAVQASNALTGEMVIEGFITFVTIEELTASKKVHQVRLDETEDEAELQLRDKAVKLIAQRV